MVGRKSMGRISPALLVLLSLGCAFATYNLITMVRRYQAGGGERELAEFESVARFADPVVRMPDNSKKVMVFKRRFHVALTATDASYSKWQCRIMYYWYKKTKELEGSEMDGFTRVLHSGKPDDLMDEIPTFVVDPLPSGLDLVRVVLDMGCGFGSFGAHLFSKQLLPMCIANYEIQHLSTLPAYTCHSNV